MAIFIPALMAAGTGLLATAKLGGSLAMGVGGLASGVGRTLGAAASLASTATGIGSGLIKGVGKAVGVEADQSTSDDLGNKALPPGVKLNKNGVMVQDKGGKGGGQVLPGQFDDDGALMSMDDRLGSMEAPDRGDAGPVQQILDYVKNISANTARTAAGMSMLSTSMMQSNTQTEIDDEKEGTGNDGSGGGILSRAFGSIGKTLKESAGSLSKAAKFTIKSLALGGLLYLFMSKREEIQTAIAGIFKYFHELYETVKNSDDPMQTLFDELKLKLKELGNGLMTMFKDFYKKTIEPMLSGMMGYVKKTVMDFVNGALYGQSDAKVMSAAGDLQSATAELDALSAEVGPRDDSGFFGTKGLDNLGYITKNVFNDEIESSHTNVGTAFSNDQATADQRVRITNAARKAYEAMWNLSRGSEWQIQWTDMPMMSKGLTFFKWMDEMSKTSGLDFVGGTAISVLRDSQPIVAGNIIDRKFLLEGNYDPEALFGYSDDMSAMDIESIKGFNQELTNLMHKDVGVAGNILDGDTYAHIGAKLDFTTASQAMDKVKIQKYAIGGRPQLLNELQGVVNGTHEIVPIVPKKIISTPNNNAESKSQVIVTDAHMEDNKVVKQGDTVMMPLSAFHSDPTAHALHEWKYA